jgi:hypothetical protein
VDLLRQLVLLERDVPAKRQIDAIRLGWHSFCDSAEGFMIDDTSPLESANLGGIAPDAGYGLLNFVNEHRLAPEAARAAARKASKPPPHGAPRAYRRYLARMTFSPLANV